MERTNKNKSLATQMKLKIKNGKLKPKKNEYDGDVKHIVSTGSTLLDLSISGGRIRGGGIPSGIMVEFFGPESTGKTVMLCEIAGAIQRKNGRVLFQDPEARLNKQFAAIFDMQLKPEDYSKPNKVIEVFKKIREWVPGLKEDTLNGIFTDSLAALSTDIEMNNDDGDKMGMKRAKDFSAEFRKNARILAENNILMVNSNQVRDSQDAYGPKVKSTGGRAIGFYSSLRIQALNYTKIKHTIKIHGKEVTRIKGVTTNFHIFKSSVWKPFRTVPVTIIFDYGIDDIRQNLQFIKDHTSNKVYTLGGDNLDASMEKSIAIIEEEELEKTLKEEVIDLWEAVERKFEISRIPKRR